MNLSKLPIALSLLLGVTLQAHAGSATWASTSGTAWNVNGNWNPNTGFPSAAADTAVFDSTVALPTSAISLGQNIGITSLTLQGGTTPANSSLTITDGSFGLSLGGTSPLTNNAGQSLTFNAGVTFGSASASTVTLGGNSTTTFASGFTENAANLTFTGQGAVNFNSTVSSNKQLIFTANAGLNLGHGITSTIHLGNTTGSGNNDSSLIITTNNVTDGGVVQVAGIGSGGASKNTFTIGANITGGGTATYNGSFSIDNSANSNTGTVVLSSNSGTTLNFNSVIASAASTGLILQVSGGGLVVFNAPLANSYVTSTAANGTEVKNSTVLQLNDASGVALTGSTTVDSGSTILISNSGQMTAGTMTLNGAGGTTGGVLASATTGALENSSGNNTLSAAVALGSASTIASDTAANTLTLTGGITNAGNTATFTGAGNIAVSTTGIGGTGGLSKTGLGDLTLNTANGYSGATSITAGRVLMGNGTSGNALGSGALTIGVNGTLGGYSASTVTSTAVVGTSSNSTFSISGNVTVGTGSDAFSGIKLAASGTGSFTGANLTFDLATTSTNANLLDLGATNVNFANTKLTLNLIGTTGITGNIYRLITDSAGFTSPGDGLTLTNINGQNVITGGLSIGNSTFFGASSGGFATGFYNGSYLFVAANGDDIDVEIVPEPGTWALMLGGLGLLIAWQRRARRL